MSEELSLSEEVARAIDLASLEEPSIAELEAELEAVQAQFGVLRGRLIQIERQIAAARLRETIVPLAPESSERERIHDDIIRYGIESAGTP